ncbi:MAG: hypothetical protein MI923_00820 [Phycisphaerales bacterium]|nr:hypothetical protein [Phycisphaerales bacterium]
MASYSATDGNARSIAPPLGGDAVLDNDVTRSLKHPLFCGVNFTSVGVRRGYTGSIVFPTFVSHSVSHCLSPFSAGWAGGRIASRPSAHQVLGACARTMGSLCGLQASDRGGRLRSS